MTEASNPFATFRAYQPSSASIMNSRTKIMPIDAPAANTATARQRLFTACFLTITAMAALGWWAALSWVAIALVGWSFS